MGNRQSFTFRDLSYEQYEAIITASEMDGNTSPMHGRQNYDSLMAAARAADADPRLALVWTLFECHDGTDPAGGIALARVYNFGGIKVPGGDYDSGIAAPPSEGGVHYAGFNDFGSFARHLYDTFSHGPEGPYWAAGDLANVASIYITGQPNTGRGTDRLTQLDYYQRHYPPGDGSDNAVYGDDIIAQARRYLGQSTSDNTLDPWNPKNHPWGGWCESFAEGVPISLGLMEVHRASALDKLAAVRDQGLLQTTWPPEHGAWCLFGITFDPQGHICFWDADKEMYLTTLEQPSSIGYHTPSGWRAGMAGWCRIPGVADARRPASADYRRFEATGHGIYGDFRGYWEQFRDDAQALKTFGLPLSEREPGPCEDGQIRTVQWFERARFEDWGGGNVNLTRLGASVLKSQGRTGPGISTAMRHTERGGRDNDIDHLRVHHARTSEATVTTNTR